MLNIDNITVQYGNNKPTLENLSLEMKQGEIVSIVGESGSGKSTLLNVLSRSRYLRRRRNVYKWKGNF